MLGPIAGGLIVGLQWRFIFFLNLPIGIAGLVMVYLHLPDYREPNTKPLDIVGLILFGSGIALLSYVLEIFGEHTLGPAEILGLLALSVALIVGYGLHAMRTAFPLLQLSLFRIRTFGAAVSGSFFTRLGIGGVPFLLPLLYQVGLGFDPVQSGLLIMPQAIGAMSTKFLAPRILDHIGRSLKRERLSVDMSERPIHAFSGRTGEFRAEPVLHKAKLTAIDADHEAPRLLHDKIVHGFYEVIRFQSQQTLDGRFRI
jgi:MFS family permease